MTPETTTQRVPRAAVGVRSSFQKARPIRKEKMTEA
jgi:hypothetical protein